METGRQRIEEVWFNKTPIYYIHQQMECKKEPHETNRVILQIEITQVKN